MSTVSYYPESDLTKLESALQSYCDRCEEFLGLNVEASDEKTFVISFSGLNPDREPCSVELKISREEGQKPYRITKCDPELDFANIEEALNETSELNGFVVALRKKFKAALINN